MTQDYIGPDDARTLFVEGPFGAGKTTFAIDILRGWLDDGVSPERILVLVPQQTLARPYWLALHDDSRPAMPDVRVMTLGSIVQEACELHWPWIAERFGFHEPDHPPHFLNIETTQYAMSSFVNEAMERGEFDALSVSPQGIARQLFDAMSKTALMGQDYRVIPSMLIEAWGPDRPMSRVLAYEAAGRVSEAYRQYCLEHRLLDFPHQVQLFDALMGLDDYRERFFDQCTHLIAEHAEEENVLIQDIISDWLPRLDAALLTYEWEGGYRTFLGAAPDEAYELRDLCDATLILDRSFITTPPIDRMREAMSYALGERDEDAPSGEDETPLGFSYAFHTYFPQMLDWVADTITGLVYEDGIPPHEIVVLAPYLSDALRFSLRQKLDRRGIASVSHRPSRALADEPAARCLLTLAALAHPHWGQQLHEADVAQALDIAIGGLDPIRARLLAKVVYRKNSRESLTPFERINPQMQSRITYEAGERYSRFHDWLTTYQAGEMNPIDDFFSRLFGEVLSQEGFGFHDDPEAGRIANELVQSARHFRRSLFDVPDVDLDDVGKQYLGIVSDGLLAALYVSSWRDETQDAVFMAPAYTYLMRSRPATIQFWLDVGSMGWWERLDQPLTHPYVLSRQWQHGEESVWMDSHDFARQQDMIHRIVTGLLRRCRRHVYLGISDFGEQGFEQRGPMLRVFQQVLRHHPQPALEGES